MKPHPELTSQAILDQMVQPGTIETIKAVGRTETPEEKAAAQEAFTRILKDIANKVKAVCVACETASPILEMKMCECGGFVCKTCEALEDEGKCEHEVPSFPEDDD